MQISGVILAGGKSRRMQVNKAFLAEASRPLIEIIREKVAAVAAEVIIVTNDPTAYLEVAADQIVTDLIPRRGPLGGIHAGVEAASFSAIFVTACDMPFITPSLINLLCQKMEETEAEAVVPFWQEKWQPLCALYHKSCLPAVERCLKEARLKVTSFYPSIRVQPLTEDEIATVGDPQRLFFNVNRPEDWELARRWLRDEAIRPGKGEE
ncbi:MAG: molybdenum cofactor guanylyltransferase [Eubacteriales bacterium]|nr:molybdenum cofactor guanylyltransferase [Eubacteriales bacterium]MDN5363338.1 molybdenum cofactor guanylyltransferase [Eubacteriales bacterium]